MVILDNFPLWAVYLGTVVLALLVAEIGFRIGMWFQSRATSTTKGMPVTGTVVGGVLALLAFLMAFSTGIVAGQHDGRRSMVVTEVNAVGTAYLRAAFLDEPDLTTTRGLLREYVEVRLAAVADPAQLEFAETRSEEIHGELWAIVEENVRQGRESAIMALFVESINEVIDVHTLRLAAVNLRLPRVLGRLLYGVLLLSFLLVGVANSGNQKRDFAAMVLFAMVFAAALMTIFDIDRPQQGTITVGQTALTDLLRQMTVPAP